MRGGTHLAAGTLIGVSLSSYYHLPLQETLITVSCSCVASLVPDLDICTSKLGRLVPPASLLIQLLLGHRGLLHTPLLYAVLLFLLSPLLTTYPIAYLYAIILGIALHLLLDLMNPKGIPLLWPVVPKRIHVAPFISGGIVDRVIGLGFTALTFFQIVRMISDTVQSVIPTLPAIF